MAVLVVYRLDLTVSAETMVNDAILTSRANYGGINAIGVSGLVETLMWCLLGLRRLLASDL